MVLDRGIEVNRFDEKGKPGPAYLVDSVPEQVQIKFLDLLIKYGYDVNALDTLHDGKPIIVHFLESIKQSPNVIKWLLEHGADPFLHFGKNKQTPYDIAKRKRVILPIFDEFISKSKLLDK